MNQEQFLQALIETQRQALDIVKLKNSDYAKETNPFYNFEFAKILGLSIEQAILIRVVDKIARVNNLLTKENTVKDESITDTLLDIINYIAILKVYIDEQNI